MAGWLAGGWWLVAPAGRLGGWFHWPAPSWWLVAGGAGWPAWWLVPLAGALMVAGWLFGGPPRPPWWPLGWPPPTRVIMTNRHGGSEGLQSLVGPMLRRIQN
ncbi:hypothetical protein [Crucivirus-501]|nr:hypothetical protein [Crucivirus-501]